MSRQQQKQQWFILIVPYSVSFAIADATIPRRKKSLYATRRGAMAGGRAIPLLDVLNARY